MYRLGLLSLLIFATAGIAEAALTRTLSFGARGSDVVELQTFLIDQELLAADSATGYFGRMTEAAVQKFQSTKGIVSSGSPATTGYGAAGPKTRAWIVQTSTKPTVPTTTPPASTTPQVATSSEIRGDRTIDAWLKSAASPSAYKAFSPLVGSFDADGNRAATRLKDVYGNVTPAQLKAKLDADFKFTERFGPNRPWNQQIKLCQGTAGELVGRCLRASDTVDWLILQMALFSMPDDKSAWLILPATGKHYVVNKALSVSSHERLRWTPSSNGTFSYLYSKPDRTVGDPLLGTVIGTYNPYWYQDPSPTQGNNRLGSLVEDIVIEKPHIDGTFSSGDNGLSFVRGVKDIRIEGGVIRNLLFDPGIQSGRGVMCEQGCQNLSIRGTTIQSTTFGISSHVDQRFGTASSSAPYPYIQNGITEQTSLSISNITMRDVEIPFTFVNENANAAASDQQRVSIDGVRIENGGALTRAKVKNNVIPYFSFTSTTDNKQYFCMNRTAYVTDAYDTVNEFQSAQAAGIFVFNGGRNVNIRNVTINNDSSYPMIGGIVRGEDAARVSLENVTFTGKVKAPLNFTGSPRTPDRVFSDSSFSKISVSGYQYKKQIDTTRFPFSRATKTSTSIGAKDACSPALSNENRLPGITTTDITYSALSAYAGQ